MTINQMDRPYELTLKYISEQPHNTIYIPNNTSYVCQHDYNLACLLCGYIPGNETARQYYQQLITTLTASGCLVHKFISYNCTPTTGIDLSVERHNLERQLHDYAQRDFRNTCAMLEYKISPKGYLYLQTKDIK